MSHRPKALVSWSSGKDSAFALGEIRRAAQCDLVGLVTTVTEDFNRVSMHGVREELLDAQVASLGIPCHKVRIPALCSNEIYEREMGRVLTDAKRSGVTQVVFGDLFLQDIRSYREARLAELGLQGVFPLWMRDTARLAQEMLDAGMEAILSCVDPRKLDASFAGRRFDAALLRDLPVGIDPCGENGEFHTFASAGPMFKQRIPVAVGEIVERNGFVFADLLRAEAARPAAAP